ncbi:MAG: MFS transporter [Rhodobacteraceae bacterium]|nr:MAG: MFS transporter [Paracoccaceae bacterium]
MTPRQGTLAPAPPGAALATRLAFLAAGFAMGAWAPLIPFAKLNLGASEGQLGLLLLCLGVGSLVAMPATGYISAQRGARGMILSGWIGLVVLLPALMLVDSALTLGVLLFGFGAALGTIDVAMNVHGATVERRAARPMMSGFHAMWSVGGITGAGAITLLLSLGLGAFGAACVAAGLAALALLPAAPRLLRAQTPEAAPAFVLPRGVVLLLAGLTAIVFLVEGAILDWGALLIVERALLGREQAGLGFLLFSVAMTVGRLAGDRLVARLGVFRTMLWGSLLVMAGLALAIAGPGLALSMAGYVAVGLGAANLVPVLLSAAGRQTRMPAGLAIAAVTTAGYGGILLGPALIGFVAQASSLAVAFIAVGALMLALLWNAGRVTRI